MKRVLIVAYYFPPIAGIGSIRLARFAAHLPEFGWEPTVLAPTATPHPLDPDLDYPEERVLRARSLEISRAGRVFAQRGASGGEPRRAGPARKLRAAAKRILAFPDAQAGWYPGAVRAGSRALRSESFDAIYSSSFPITAHLVAATLARRAQLPWLAEFRDPWSPFVPRVPWRRAAERLEQRIVSAATRVAMPTPTWAAHFGGEWAARVEVLPNGFDAPIPSRDPQAEQPILAHLGTYYPGRQTLAPLWQELRRLADRNPAVAPRVRFIGEIPRAGRTEIESAGIGHLVDEVGVVPHPEALDLLGSCTALVAAGGSGRDALARGWIPAKLFEYLATDRPILYLGDPAGDAARLLARQPGCYVVDAANRDDVAGPLRAALEGASSTRDVRDLTRRAGTARLAAVLESIAS